MSFSGTKGWITKPPPGSVEDPFHPLSQGSVCHLLMNEGSGSRVYDISGHGNHGTLKNMLPNVQGSGWGGSKFGGGLQFDGVDDYVDCGSDESLNITEAITVEAWVKPALFLTGRSIVEKGTNIYRIYMSDTSGVLTAYIVGLTGGYSLNFGSAIPADEWSYIMLTYDKDGGTNNYKTYINGVLSSQGTRTGAISTSADSLHIGSEMGNLQFFNGAIDYVRIYNRALSAGEVKTLYHDPFCNLLRVPIRRYRVPMTIMNQFQRANIGADLYNGAIIA